MGWIGFGAVLTLVLALVGGLWLEDFFAALMGLFIGLVITMLIFYPLGYASHDERYISCTVEDKDRGGNDGSYRIYTKNCGVLANADQWLKGKTNSADVWNQIKPGETQTFHVVGWRFSPLSDFPNILEVK